MPHRPVRVAKHYHIMHVLLLPANHTRPSTFHKRAELGAPLPGHIPPLAPKQIQRRIIEKIMRYPREVHTPQVRPRAVAQTHGHRPCHRPADVFSWAAGIVQRLHAHATVRVRQGKNAHTPRAVGSARAPSQGGGLTDEGPDEEGGERRVRERAVGRGGGRGEGGRGVPDGIINAARKEVEGCVGDGVVGVGFLQRGSENL